MSNFLSDLLEYTRESESPKSYFLWSALATIATVMRDNVYHEITYDRTYPNMYIMLIGPPGLGKKKPLEISSALIRGTKNTKVIDGAATMQGVTKYLGLTGGGSEDPKGACGIMISTELSAFVIKDPFTTGLLTEMWDYHEEWNKQLASSEVHLKRLCLNLFAATNETLMATVFDAPAIFGGLLSRSIMVVEKRKRRCDSMIKKSSNIDGKSYIAKLSDHLKNLAKLKGNLEFTDEASYEFDNWYMKQWVPYEDSPRTRTGIEGRMKTHVKKVSMNLAMCEGTLDPVIRKDHVEFAIELCVKLYNNYKVISMESGKSVQAHPAAVLMRFLMESPNHELARDKILRRNIGELDVETLDKVVITLTGAGLLIEIHNGNNVSYRLTAKAIEMYATTKEMAQDKAKGKEV